MREVECLAFTVRGALSLLRNLFRRQRVDLADTHAQQAFAGIAVELFGNGVGIDAKGNAVFAISEAPVTFYEFAKLFRDGFKCRNALFFDGSVSSLYARELGRNDTFLPLGPMVGAFESQ